MTDLSKMELLIVVVCLRARGQVEKTKIEEEIRNLQIQFNKKDIVESCKKLLDYGLIEEDKMVLKISDPSGYDFLNSIKIAVKKDKY